MQQPREIIDRVKEATDLPALAEELTSVKLKKHGNSYVGLCPFHNEKTPSFKIKAARRSYYKCFGCGKCGDCFTFVQEVTGRTFGEALQFLAERAQVQLLQRQTTPEAEQARQQREAMAHALRFAADYYETQRQQTPQTRDFLRDHGLNEITAQRFRIGYAPEGMSALIDAAQQAHIAAETLVAAGLAAQHPSGHHYDVFRNRMVFPIRSTSNRIVGFTSRGLTDHPKAPVYRDAPETALYRKGDILYGHEKARPAIRDKGGVLLVAGYTDVMSLHQAGLQHAVTPCGPELTPRQVQKLARDTKTMTIVHDNTAASLEATTQAVGVVLRNGMTPYVVELPARMTPDALIRMHGVARFKDLLKTRKLDFVAYLHARAEAANRLKAPEDRADSIRYVLSHVHLIEEPILRGEYEKLMKRHYDLKQLPAAAERTPPPMTPRPKVIFTHLKREQAWGIRSDRELTPGDQVAVSKRDGGQVTVTVGRKIWDDRSSMWLYAIDRPLETALPPMARSHQRAAAQGRER